MQKQVGKYICIFTFFAFLAILRILFAFFLFLGVAFQILVLNFNVKNEKLFSEKSKTQIHSVFADFILVFW